MNTRIAIALAAAATLSLSACSTSVQAPAAPTVDVGMAATEKGGERHEAVTVRATVEKVDLEKRKVTLRGFDGAVETISVGNEVRNLEQVKKGDEVVATYYQSVAFEVVPDDGKMPSASAIEASARAQEGEKPGAASATSVTMVADVLKLDRTSRTAVLRDANGETATVNVENPAAFDKVKVGDRVRITLTEAMAIDVQPAPKK